MHKTLRGESWLRQLAVVAVFGVSVSLFRELSISHWAILAGFYLTTLMLAPYRYWPALVIGEVASLAHFSLVNANSLGMAWAIGNLVPSLLLLAPVVYWAREHGAIFSRDRNVRISALLLCSLIGAFLLTLNSLALGMLTKFPPHYPPIDYGAWCARWILGNYLGILTITPLALFAHQELAGVSWKALKHKVAQSRLILEIGCVLIPALAFLIWLGLNAASNPQIRQIIQFAMFLPVVWLALRHGWHGAAVGGSCASIAILALMPHRYDIDTLQAEILIAFVISTMLLMGARIAVLDSSRKSEREDLRMALALAQRNVQMGEMQLRMTSQSLEQIGLAVHSVCMTMTDRFRLPHGAIEDRGYQHLALTAKDQLFGLADSLYPAGWEERGIASALREGQIPRMLDKAGIKYWCAVRGSLDHLSANFHLTIYRMACDAIADHCAKRNVSEIGIKLRSGDRKGRRWVLLTLSFRTNPAALQSVSWNQLLPQILPAGSGRGFSSIQDRAATFEGRARERALPRENRISVMLLDPVKAIESALH